MGIAPTFSAIGLNAGETLDIPLRVIDAQGATADATSTVIVEQPQAADVLNVVENLVESGITEIEFAVDAANADDFFEVVASLPPSTSENVDISLELESAIYGGQKVSVAPGYRVVIDGKAERPIITGASPALEILSGQVVVQNSVQFVNATEAPTIRVHDGSLTLRDVVVEESTVGDQAAIEILGGHVDLGTESDLGGNTINVVEAGEAIRNVTSDQVNALGNTFEVDGVELDDPFLIENFIHHQLDQASFGLVRYLSENVAPRAQIDDISPLVVPVGTPVSFSGSFVDVGMPQVHMATWSFLGLDTTGAIEVPGMVDETPGMGTVAASFQFDEPNIYRVRLTLSDGIDSTVTDMINGAEATVIVCDPLAGFVTGGGWIDSPAGAVLDDPSLAGRASFGFEVRYQKDAPLPTGNVKFTLQRTDFHFRSESYDWMVITDSRAQFQGRGTINGSGDYGFMITVIDQPDGDRFQIEIWDHVSGDFVYDSSLEIDDDPGSGNALGGGQIVIHGTGDRGQEPRSN